MTVSFYFAHETGMGKELDFEHSFERRAAFLIAHDFWDKYHATPKHYALIFNVQAISPYQMDLIILTNDGMGVVELKNFQQRVCGDIRFSQATPWKYMKNGHVDALVDSPTYGNPFYQVWTYRKALYGKLSSTKNLPLPNWLNHPKQFHLYASVASTSAPLFEYDFHHYDPSTKLWFTPMWMYLLSEWAMTLAFGENRTLTDKELEVLISHVFHAVPWQEIAQHTRTEQVWGKLVVQSGEQAIGAHPLNRGRMRLGRAWNNDLVLDNKTYPGISRHHVTIAQTPEKAMIIDNNSTFGTFLNGERLITHEVYELHYGDRISFGQTNKKANCNLIYQQVDPLDSENPTSWMPPIS